MALLVVPLCYLDNELGGSRQRAHCPCSRGGWGDLSTFSLLSSISFLHSLADGSIKTKSTVSKSRR